MHRPNAIRLALVGACALLARAPAADAQEAPDAPAIADPAADPVVVLVIDRRGEPDPQPIIQALRGQVSDLPVQLEIHWASPPAELPRQVWMAQQIARVADAEMVLWLAPLAGDRLYVMVPGSVERPLLERHLGEPSGGGSAEVTAIIARNAIRAWLAGAPIEAEPVVVEPEPTTTPLPPPREQRPVPPPAAPIAADQPWGGRLSLDVAYAYLALGADHRAVHGAAFALNVWLAHGVRAFAGYVAQESVTGTAFGFTLALRRHPILFGARWSHPVGPVELGVSLAAAIDIVDESFETVPQGGAPAGDRREIQSLLRPALRLDWPLVEWLRVFVCAGIELPLNRIEYHVQLDGEDRTIIETWPARPVIDLGFAAGFL